MLRLEKSLQAWNTPGFTSVLKQELARSGNGALPLQQCLASTSVALDGPSTVVVHGADEERGCLLVRVGVFFEGIIAGCACDSDPTPVEPQIEYAELLLSIDCATAETRVEIIGP